MSLNTSCFVSEITIFAVMASFRHSCMGWILISFFFFKLNIYYVRDWLWEAPVGSLHLKSASKNLSLSPDLHAAAHVRSGEAACLIIGLIPQCSGCVTECCDSHPLLCSLSQPPAVNKSPPLISLFISL